MTAKSPKPLDVLGCRLSGMTLIEASAGTGKTWNICMLYLRLLLEKELTVPEILVVTFTNAATAELKERIRARLTEMLLFVETGQETDPFLAKLATQLEQRGIPREKTALSLKAALASFDEAMILTIHGFCRKIAATLAFETGQPFAFEVSQEEQETLCEVVEDFWRKHIATSTVDKTLAHYLYTKNITPQTLCDFLKREIYYPLAQKRWPNNLSLANQQAMTQLRKAYGNMKNLWPSCREAVSDLITHALKEKALNANQYKNVPQILDTYEQLFQYDDPAAFFAEDSALKRLGKLTTSALVKAQNKGKTAPAHPFFDQAQTWMEKRDAAVSLLELAYLRLLDKLSKEVTEVRRRRQANRLLSPDDMLYRLYDALRDPALPTLPETIRKLCPAALVDEFQDTDPLQLFIFRKIYADSNQPLFFVGDPKQAIYRFRNADLHTYLAAKKKVNALYALTANQRSTPEIIAACNALFTHNPNAFMLEGMAYFSSQPGERKREALSDQSLPAKTAKSGMVIWQLPTGASRLTRAQAKQAAAAATAAEIARLLKESQAGLIAIGKAPLKASDIAVLVRTHNEAGIIQQALATLGLPSVSLSQGNIWHTSEANELTCILSAVAQPRRQACLKAALATEMLGLDAADLEEMAHSDKLQLVWLETFMTYQAAWLERGAGFVIRQIMAKHHIPTRLLMLPNGERRLTNLLHLTELLHEAGQTYPLPEALLRWITQQRDTATGEQTQLRLESDEKLIHILTIHASKGLEFPFIFCPFLWDAYRNNRKSNLPGLLYQEGAQLIMDFREHSDAEKNAIHSLMQVEEAAEHLRLIYVALTRAIYRCYLVAGCYLQTTSNKPSVKSSTRGILNWLVNSDNNISPQEWLEGDKERANTIEANWKKLAGKKTGITLIALPETNGNILPSPENEPLPPLQAAALPDKIASGWRIGSYSSLVYGAMHETPGSDKDERTLGQLQTEENLTLPPDDILHFPASRYAGNCLHAVFEKADFTDDTTWGAAINQALLSHPPYGRTLLPEKEKTQALPTMIYRMLQHVLATPLHDGLRLETVGVNRRLTELEFFLPVKHLSAAALNTLIDEPYRGSRLAFPALEGYVRGVIDLIAEHNNRFYLLDWKSNFLGTSQADYADKALEQAMIHHNYHLQHLLYTVALNRYLSQRLPGYTYAQHFGGTLYLFVRGIRPEWKTADGRPCGVFFHRADEKTIQRIDALLWEGTLS